MWHKQQFGPYSISCYMATPLMWPHFTVFFHTLTQWYQALFETMSRDIGKTSTVEASVNGQPRETEKVSATGAGRLWECVNI